MSAGYKLRFSLWLYNASSWQPGSLLSSHAESVLSSTYWGREDDLDI